MSMTIPNEADAGNVNQAEWDSVDVAILAQALKGEGVVAGAGGECAVAAQASPNMTVQVADGVIRVGEAAIRVNALASLAIGTANSLYPRFDLITVDNAGTLACTAGSAAVEPVFPAVPANRIALAAVYVPAGDTTISSGQIIDKRCLVPYRGRVDREATELDVVNSSAETTIYSWTVPGDLLGTDRAVRMCVVGDYLNNTGASQNLILRVKFGATTIYNDTVSIATGTYRAPFVWEILLANQDSVSVQWMGGRICITLTTTGATTGIGNLDDETEAATAIAGTAAETSSGSLTLALTVQHGNANANLSIRREFAFVELV